MGAHRQEVISTEFEKLFAALCLLSAGKRGTSEHGQSAFGRAPAEWESVYFPRCLSFYIPTLGLYLNQTERVFPLGILPVIATQPFFSALQFRIKNKLKNCSGRERQSKIDRKEMSLLA